MLVNNFETLQLAQAENKTPLLGFEQELLAEQLLSLGVEQEILGRLLGDAMSQSSETFHDNAPAEVINSESIVLGQRVRSILRGLNQGVIVGYPSPIETYATLGSIVGIQYPGDPEVEHMLLTGFCRQLPDLKPNSPYPQLTRAITISSPLGRALLGEGIGAQPVFAANERDLHVDVTSLAQLDPAYLAPTSGSQIVALLKYQRNLL